MDKINGKIIELLRLNGAPKMAEMIAQRREKGIKEYGQDIDAANLTDKEVKQHLIEELLDAAVYVEKLISIIDTPNEPMFSYRLGVFRSLRSVIIAQLAGIEDIEESK